MRPTPPRAAAPTDGRRVRSLRRTGFGQRPSRSLCRLSAERRALTHWSFVSPLAQVLERALPCSCGGAGAAAFQHDGVHARQVEPQAGSGNATLGCGRTVARCPDAVAVRRPLNARGRWRDLTQHAGVDAPRAWGLRPSCSRRGGGTVLGAGKRQAWRPAPPTVHAGPRRSPTVVAGAVLTTPPGVVG